ncbi:MAG TPA: AAA family ATPase, partial [Negativicutes bacterium]|nr:AAA family ATPase [Negativicutes bacterium]
MTHRNVFPFAAVVGQEQVKRALLIALVNPKAGGVLVAGEKGAAKSTIVRGIAEIVAYTLIVELPLNATEDMLFGSLDIEYAVANGERRFSPGILARADGNVLYIDEINLLRRELLTAVLEVAASGVNVVEREGISYRHACRFSVIGTMNPEEGTLPPQILDRFGLYAAVEKEAAPEARAEIVRRTLAYERQPEELRRRYETESRELVRQVAEAKAKAAVIDVPEAMIMLAAQLCAQARCAGHRAEIYLLEAAKAVAALAGREYLLPSDVDEAAMFVLPHRMRREEQPPPEAEAEQPDGRQDEQTGDREDEQQHQPEQQPEGQDGRQPPGEDPEQRNDPPEGDREQPADGGAAEDKTAPIDKTFPQVGIDVALPQDRQARRGSGKRSLTRTSLKQGRYVRACQPAGAVTDLAFDATVRAAAPYQRVREKGPCQVSICQEDLRQKVREKRIGNVFLFVVDASGSMGARERMRAVKGAIFAILREAYQKRDQVGMIAFRRQSAEVLLPVTRSIDLAEKCLRDLPTGGKTPLAEGLY